MARTISLKCSTLLVVFLTAITIFPNQGRSQTRGARGATATKCTFSVSLGAGPSSFDQLTNTSLVIAEATVQSIFPTTELEPLLATDALLRIDRVQKGPNELHQIVVSQLGGVLGDRKECTDQYAGSLMEPGQRYLVFLTSEDPKRISRIPERPGIPRYGINGVFAGLVLIDKDIMHLSPDLDFTRKYEGKSFADFLAEIEAKIRFLKP